MPPTRTGTARVPGRTTRSLVFATAVVTLVSALRAASDGPTPSATIMVPAILALTVAVRPLTRARRGFPAILGGMTVSVLLLRALFLLAQTGRLTHDGPVGWLCSPATTPGADPTGPCATVSHGGSGLLVAQLIAVVLLAGAATGLERHVWSWTLVAAHRVRHAAATLVVSVMNPVAPLAVAGPTPTRSAAPTRPTHTGHCARSTPRRGPPAR